MSTSCTNAVIKVFTGTSNGAFIPHVFNTQTSDTNLDITDILVGKEKHSPYYDIKKWLNPFITTLM